MGLLEDILAILKSIDSKIGNTSAPVNAAELAPVAAAVSQALPTANTTTLPTGGTPPATTPTVGADVEVDSRGFPWDERIHASSKEKLAKDASWKLKRGIAGTPLLAEVEASYVAQGFGQAPAAAAPAATLPAATPPTGSVGLPGLPPINTTAAAPAAKVQITMPVVDISQPIDDNTLTQVAAAAIVTLGEAKVDVILGMLQLTEDQAVTEIPDQYRASFYRLVTEADLRAQYPALAGE